MASGSKQKAPLIIRGSVVKVRRKCGKEDCRCMQGKMHQTWALSYSYRGRTKMIPLRPQHISIARKAINRYKKEMAQLESKALNGIKQLHATVKTLKKEAYNE